MSYTFIPNDHPINSEEDLAILIFLDDKELVAIKCLACQTVIVCDPKTAHSIRRPSDSKRRPICKDCFNSWNDIHRPQNPIPFDESAYYDEDRINNIERGIQVARNFQRQ